MPEMQAVTSLDGDWSPKVGLQELIEIASG
jgi:hypothetical protein